MNDKRIIYGMKPSAIILDEQTIRDLDNGLTNVAEYEKELKWLLSEIERGGNK